MKILDPSVIDLVRRFMTEQIPFNKVLGLRPEELREGFARLVIPFRPELIGDPFRPAIHGGVISALIDTCGGAAAFTMISAGDTVSTIDLRVDYLRPGLSKDLVCDSTVTRMGNRVASIDSKVYQTQDGAEYLVATGKAVYNVKRVDSDQ